MSLPPPPPPGTGAAPRPSGRRTTSTGWIVAVAVLSVGLIAALSGLVLTSRSLADAREERDAQAGEIDQLEQALSDLARQPAATESRGDAGEGSTGEEGGSDGGAEQGDAGSDDPSGADPSGADQGDAGSGDQGDAGSGGLGDLLDDLLGSLGDGGGLQDTLDDLLGGLGGAGESLGSLDPRCMGDAGSILRNLGGDGVQGTVEEQVLAIADLVETDRELAFETAVEPVFLDEDEFEQRVADEVEEGYPDEQADLDGRLLGLLGAIPKGTDLKALQGDLLRGQVAGFYDPEAQELVVPRDPSADSLSVTDQVTLAHELDHALTDQALGLPEAAAEDDTDGNLAATALVEGDATLIMQRFSMEHVGLLDQLGAAVSPDMRASQQDLEKVPPYLRSELMFPYLDGLAYVCSLHRGEDWDAVDAAYDELPQSTAEILFPEKAGLGPVDPADPAEPGGSWEVVRRDTLGAAPLLWLLEAPGGDESAGLDDARDLASHWAGGELVLATDGERSAVGVALVDSEQGGALCDGIERWYSAAFDTSTAADGDATVMEGDGQYGVLRCEGDDVRLGIAPDQTTAGRLAS